MMSDDVHPRGLKNLGNTCYLNSILQSLSSCPSFIHYLEVINNNNNNDINNNHHLSLFSSKLLNCIRELRKKSSSLSSLNVRVIFEALAIYSPEFEGSEQQDALEAFEAIVSIVKDDRRIMMNNHRRSIFSCINSSEKPSGKSLRNNLFDGLLNSQLQCQDCLSRDGEISRRYHPTRHQSFMTLPLTIQLHRDNQKVKEEEVEEEEDHHHHQDNNNYIYQRKRFSANLNILNTKNKYDLSTILSDVNHYSFISNNYNSSNNIDVVNDGVHNDDNDDSDDIIHDSMDVKEVSDRNNNKIKTNNSSTLTRLIGGYNSSRDSSCISSSGSSGSSSSSSSSSRKSNCSSMNVNKGRNRSISSRSRYMDIYSCLDEYFKIEKLSDIHCNACLIRHTIKSLDAFDHHHDHHPLHRHHPLYYPQPCNNYKSVNNDDDDDNNNNDDRSKNNNHDNVANHDIYDSDKRRYFNMNNDCVSDVPYHSGKQSVMSDSNGSSSRDSMISNNDLTTIETTTTTTNNNNNNNNNSNITTTNTTTTTTSSISGSVMSRYCHEHTENNYISNKRSDGSSNNNRSSSSGRNVNFDDNHNYYDNNLIKKIIKSYVVTSKNDCYIKDLSHVVTNSYKNYSNNTNNNNNKNNNESSRTISTTTTNFNTIIKEQILISLSNMNQSKLNKSIVMKYLSIARLPSLLCLYLCRRTYMDENNNYYHKMMKLNHHISFPIILNMSRYCDQHPHHSNHHHHQHNNNNNEDDDGCDDDNNSSDNNNYKYNLKAVVVHQGNADGGHYVSYCLLNSNSSSSSSSTTPSTIKKWIMFSDDNYKEVSESFVLKVQATMLFYDKL